MTDTIPSTVDIDTILRAIPHRYPFLLVDKVKDIVPSKSAIGVKNVTMNEPQFNGHFPGLPIFPGVLIVEALAQTSAVLVSLSLNLVGTGAVVYFMGIDKCKFRRKVVPGDVLELHCKALRGGGKIWKFEGKGIVDGEIACEAEFTAMMDQPAREAADG